VTAVVALGGNALMRPGERGTAAEQRANLREACAALRPLLDEELVVTHGNGPQVGNLLVKNEIAATVVPPVPLDWCGAQTQGTLGTLLLDALDEEFARRDIRRPVAALVTRTLVDPGDPGFRTPTKPIGRYLPLAEATGFRPLSFGLMLTLIAIVIAYVGASELLKGRIEAISNWGRIFGQHARPRRRATD